MDPISFGATVGAVMELYEMGVLTKEQLGIEAPFGSTKALTYFAEITGKGEGFGKEIALGSKRLTEKYGHPDLSMSVKGQEFPAYDSRGIQGMGLAYATANRGACHLRGYTVASEVLGIPVKTDPLVTEGKAGWSRHSRTPPRSRPDRRDCRARRRARAALFADGDPLSPDGQHRRGRDLPAQGQGSLCAATHRAAYGPRQGSRCCRAQRPARRRDRAPVRPAADRDRRTTDPAPIRASTCPR